MQPTVKRLAGRTAIVTGGGQGIGRGCALRLAEEGANVAFIDLDPAVVNETAAALQCLNARVHAVTGDCCDNDVATRFVAEAEHALGPTDVLINNVGQSAREKQGPFLVSEEATWRFVIEINLFTTMRFSR